MNKCEFIGRLAQDPEVRYTATGKAVANFSVAVSRGKPKEGEKESADFIKIQCWQGMAESAGNKLSKGDEVLVVGKWQNRSYETADGQKRYTTELVAEFIGQSITNKDKEETHQKPSSPFNSMGTDEDLCF